MRVVDFDLDTPQLFETESTAPTTLLPINYTDFYRCFVTGHACHSRSSFASYTSFKEVSQGVANTMREITRCEDRDAQGMDVSIKTLRIYERG